MISMTREDKLDITIDKCIQWCLVAYVCLYYAFTCLFFVSDIPMVEEEEAVGHMSNYHYAYLEHTKLRVMMYSIDVMYNIHGHELVEEPGEEFNCLFYACEPIGRYYITGYNHKETGSKMTASGATCHEGTITTCAADPRYHKFGEYLEIDGRLYVVEDTGSAVKKKHIDLYFYDYNAMARYGSNYQTIYRVTFPFGKPKAE